MSAILMMDSLCDARPTIADKTEIPAPILVPVNLALQCGGSSGAFTRDMLDRFSPEPRSRIVVSVVAA